MRKIAVIFSLVAGTFVLAKCTPKAAKTVAESPSPAAPPEAPVAPATPEVAGGATYTDQEIASGKVIYANNCGKCHALYAPEKYDQARWVKIMNAMVPKAKLNEMDGNLARAYVYANAKKG